MKIKPPKNILILTMMLFFINAGLAQLSKHPLLVNTSVAVGLSFSKMMSDSIYDEDLGRVNYGLYYNKPISQSLDLDIGALFTQKGGKSFQEDTYQTFGYLDFPVKVNYLFSDKFKMGLGGQFSYLAFNNTKKRGLRSVIDPNPHPYNPKVLDFSAIASIDMAIAPNADIALLSSYSFASSQNPDTDLNFGTIALQLRVGLSSSINSIEELAVEARQDEIDLVKLKFGYTLVCLNARESTAKFYADQGDTARANQILKDARIKNKALKAAFIKHYSYSTVLFLDNKYLSKACNGDSDVVLYDADGNQVGIETIKNEFFVFFKPGSIYENASSFNRSGYEFLGASCNKLPDPFPAFEFALAGDFLDMNKMIRDLNARMLSRENSIRSKKYFIEDLLKQ